jgi:hypothetical protein
MFGEPVQGYYLVSKLRASWISYASPAVNHDSDCLEFLFPPTREVNPWKSQSKVLLRNFVRHEYVLP